MTKARGRRNLTAAAAIAGGRVAPPTGPNRLYAAILPQSADIDALIGASSQSHAVVDVSALVRKMRARASAFGAYDYRIEP
jgi:hypothetical protein